MSAKDFIGMWCDDITFCSQKCERLDCPRNSENIRDRTIPHSYSVEIPSDCLLKKEITTYCGKTYEQMNKVLDTMCELEEQYQGMTEEEEEAFDIAIQCVTDTINKMKETKKNG